MRRFDWLWVILGLICIIIGLSKVISQGHSNGDMIDQFHWSQLAQAVVHDGASITLAGYMIPLPDSTVSPKVQSSKFITRFILVPYLPSCTQRPPPLSNQTVLVETAPITFSNDPVIVRGDVSALTGSKSGAAYMLHARGLRPWNRGQFAQTDDD